MKNIIRMFGIIVLLIIIVFIVVTCKDNSNNIQVKQTPVASDYEIGNMNQTAGSVIAVTIAAKSGKSPGIISNIRYNGSTEIPQSIGTYPVVFDVAAATDWNSVTGLSAGNLIVGKYIPVASDYEIVITYSSVAITQKAGKSPGAVTIFYNGSIVIPSAVGTYIITFDVEESADWYAATGLSAGIWVISQAGINLNVEQIIDEVPIFNNITISRTNTGFPVNFTVSVNESDFDTNSIKWEITCVGIYSGQTITGNDSSFTLSAAEIKYNSLGGHSLILTVSKNGLQYLRAIPFTIVQ